MREALVEYSVIGIAGAALGLAVAAVVVGATLGVLPEDMTRTSLNAVDLDGRALVFLAVVSLVTVLLFGVPPALLASRATVVDGLRRDSRSATGSVSARRFRAALVVAEVALSLVLLVGAALMTRSLLKLQATEIGLDPRGLLTLSLGMPAPAYSTRESRELFVAELLDRLRSDGDVVSVSAGPLPPQETQVAIGPIEFGDRPGERTKPTLLRVYDVWPRFFATAGITIEDGRDFADRDVEGAAIVSHEFAAKHWPGRSAVGLRFRVGESPWRTIVGVAAEVRGMGEQGASARQEIYFPRGDIGELSRPVRPSSRIADYETIVIRARETGPVMSRLSSVVHGIDSSVVVSRVRARRRSVRRSDRASANRAADAVGVRGVRPRARRGRTVRRHVVPGLAADAGNRHQAGAWRDAAPDRPADLRTRPAVRRRRCGAGSRWIGTGSSA